MNGQIQVRLGEERDAGTLVEFNRAIARETENRELVTEVVSQGVRNFFRRPQFGFYVVAEAGGALVGCMMITYEWSDWRNGLFWWVQSVYVRPDYRRRGVYSGLYEFVKSRAGEDGHVRGFRLYVERDNHIAQRVYSRLGMSETGYRMFEEVLPARS
ncbi:MAG: GNAT family N-acetyltransferase [Acidobacteriota bacterium]